MKPPVAIVGLVTVGSTLGMWSLGVSARNFTSHDVMKPPVPVVGPLIVLHSVQPHETLVACRQFRASLISVSYS